MRRIVIADAGPVIALARIEHLQLLPRLFGTVLVTAQVAKELGPSGEFPESAAITAALRGPWLKTLDVMALSSDALIDAIRDCMNLHQIDLGEASAIAYAFYVRAAGDSPLLLIDDFRGRNAAQHAGLPMIGTAGLLLLAKQAGAIAEVKPLLLAMRQGGYYLSDRLIEATLHQAAEPFRLRGAAFGGEGLASNLQGADGNRIRDFAYEGRGALPESAPKMPE